MQDLKNGNSARLAVTMLAICMMLAMMPWFGNGGAYAATATTSVKLTGTYNQTSARTMLAMINTFRTGTDAWYYDEFTGGKNYQVGLTAMTYDYNLEKIAMQRAAEIAIKFEHQRPDGDGWSMCQANGTTTYGENIACGYSTAAEAFAGWQETAANYYGQGHRRNMLDSEYTAMGVGSFTYKGYTYWVQEFGGANSGATSTAANDKETEAPVNVASSAISGLKATQATSSMIFGETKNYGDTRRLPAVTATTHFSNDMYNATCDVAVTPVWTSDDSGVAAIVNGSVVTRKAGKTTVSTTVNGTKLSIPVTVTPKDMAGLKLVKGAKKLTASWKTDSSVSGYQVVYSTNKKFSKAKKTVSINKASTGKTIIKKLKSKKTYYVKVRAIKAVEGEKLYSGYSAVAKVKVK